MSTEKAVRERPILFSGPMVRAILDGTKTQTRRAVKLKGGARVLDVEHDGSFTWIVYDRGDGVILKESIGVRCPYGVPGDRLWVRETWVNLLAVSPGSDSPLPIGPGERLIEAPTSWTDERGRRRWHYDGCVIAYRANSDIEFCDGDGFTGDAANRDDMPRWRPSIHMPRWASRLTLEITDVRVQRLQEISDEDAIAEGCEVNPFEPSGIEILDGYPRSEFHLLWDSINTKRGYPWESNPWVFALTFRRVE